MGHLYHGHVSQNQRLKFVTMKTALKKGVMFGVMFTGSKVRIRIHGESLRKQPPGPKASQPDKIRNLHTLMALAQIF